MIPLLAEALAALLPILGKAAIAAVEDATHLTDDERAAKVEALLDRAQRLERRALESEALERHRAAIRQWRRAQRAASRADRMAP